MAAVADGLVGAVRKGPEIIVPNGNWELYTGWMRPTEIEEGLFVRLTVGGEPACFVGSHKPGFDTEERVRLVSCLVPRLEAGEPAT
jgi:hypothetical protein